MAHGRTVQVSRIAGEERERVFDTFRRWGYLEANLDPLGFLKPQPHPELVVTGEAATQPQGIYSAPSAPASFPSRNRRPPRWFRRLPKRTAPTSIPDAFSNGRFG